MKTEIILHCALMFIVPTSRLKGHARGDGAREARFALYRALHTRGHSYSAIGAMLGRHYTTVMYGVREADAMVAACPDYAAKVAALVAWQPSYIISKETT
jgi:chromosomal replication initiation ATPase DnaA